MFCYSFQKCKDMTDPPDIALSPEATRLVTRITPQIQEALNDVNKVPVSVLLWGPGIDSRHPVYAVRAALRSELRRNGHAAFYSEELCDPTSSHSIRIQQLAQAQNFDLVVSIPCTPGSIGEVHDFAADRRVTAKMLVFLDSSYVDGYSPQSLEALSTLISCRIEYYPSETDTASIMEVTLDTVQRIRELKYILAGRYQL
jgi:hypothetical protein